MGQVSTMSQGEAQDRVARLRDGHQHGCIRLSTGMGLHIGVLRAEDLLGTVPGEVLNDVHIFAAPVVPTPRVPLRIFVRQHRTLGLKDRSGNEVLTRNHLERVPLAAQFAGNGVGNLGVELG